MKGKNLFIGIFTKKKREIDENKLKKRRCFNKKISTTEDDYNWNTSDWIIQESGYALGKGMALIFLVEEGLSAVGGLQGDIEYIEFSKNYPEQCFQKFTEMIGSLVPREKRLEVKEVVDMPKQREEDGLTESLEDKQEDKPESDWDRKDFERALSWAIIKQDEKREEEIFERYLAKVQDDDKERVDWQATRLYWRSIFKTGNELEQMKQLAKNYPDHPTVRWYLGLMYQNFLDFEQASEEFLRSAVNTDIPKKKVERLCHAAIAKAKAGKHKEAKNIVGEIFSKWISDNTDLFYPLKALADIALEKNDSEKYTVFSEAALLIKPDEHDLRFPLAYKYSELDKNPQALYQYKILTKNVPSEANWNNLGVADDRLKMSVKAVSAYKRSEELGGTLAMSNLAQKLISAGFLDDAQAICNAAVIIKDYDKRVGDAISGIGAVMAEEVAKEEKVLENIKERRKFSIEFSLAYRPGEKVDLPARWKSPLCDLDIEIHDDRFLAKGEYQVQEGVLASVLVRALGRESPVLPPVLPSVPKYSKRIVTYEGTIVGRAIEYELSITQETSSVSKEDTVVHKHGLMAILKDKTEILVLEKDKDNREEIYSLKPINQV